jgi:hypothetical protein
MTFYELNNFVFNAIRCESTYFTFMLYFYMFVSNMLIECNILCSFIIKLKKCISDPRKKTTFTYDYWDYSNGHWMFFLNLCLYMLVPEKIKLLVFHLRFWWIFLNCIKLNFLGL